MDSATLTPKLVGSPQNSDDMQGVMPRDDRVRYLIILDVLCAFFKRFGPVQVA
jgi:hypothetical protein